MSTGGGQYHLHQELPHHRLQLRRQPRHATTTTSPASTRWATTTCACPANAGFSAFLSSDYRKKLAWDLNARRPAATRTTSGWRAPRRMRLRLGVLAALPRQQPAQLPLQPRLEPARKPDWLRQRRPRYQPRPTTPASATSLPLPMCCWAAARWSRWPTRCRPPTRSPTACRSRCARATTPAP